MEAELVNCPEYNGIPYDFKIEHNIIDINGKKLQNTSTVFEGIWYFERMDVAHYRKTGETDKQEWGVWVFRGNNAMQIVSSNPESRNNYQYYKNIYKTETIPAGDGSSIFNFTISGNNVEFRSNEQNWW